MCTRGTLSGLSSLVTNSVSRSLVLGVFSEPGCRWTSWDWLTFGWFTAAVPVYETLTAPRSLGDPLVSRLQPLSPRQTPLLIVISWPLPSLLSLIFSALTAAPAIQAPAGHQVISSTRGRSPRPATVFSQAPSPYNVTNGVARKTLVLSQCLCWSLWI